MREMIGIRVKGKGSVGDGASKKSEGGSHPRAWHPRLSVPIILHENTLTVQVGTY
jgi:hypothetical protein